MSFLEQSGIWKCLSCETYFLPDNPAYACPKCSGTATLPTKEYDRALHKLWGHLNQTEIVCSGCGSLMESGKIVERDFPQEVMMIGEGLYWAPDQRGSKHQSTPIKGYACPKCGRVELYTLYTDKKNRSNV